MKKLLVGFAVVFLLVAGGVSWMERARIQGWYYVRELSRAEGSERDTWVKRVAALDTAALKPLLSCFRHGDPQSCANSRHALAFLAHGWGAGDPRFAALATELSQGFPRWILAGQACALDLDSDLLRVAAQTPPAILLQASARLLGEAAAVPDSEVRARALALATVLGPQAKQREIQDCRRQIVVSCLTDGRQENRLTAVRLALEPGMDLLKQLPPLLHDPAAEVRYHVLLAVGNERAHMGIDELLPWLHDPDSAVRRLCETTLRSRGLEEDHLRLGRLITDAQPQVRLQVLECLHQATDLEPADWLRRLSQDPAPAVRAAAVRAAAEQTLAGMTDQIGLIARNDPNPTVRQIAQHYLSFQYSQQEPATADR